MTPRLRRREFLRLAAATVVAASATPRIARAGESLGSSSSAEDVERVFPQGLASGDPRPESIVLWTRVEGEAASEAVTYEVALDDRFRRIVASGEVTTGPARDYTVKIKPVGLRPFTTYYYRFSALGVTSVTGRTKTAPMANQDVPVRFALASCQDYEGRYYHAWQALVEDEAPVDFVVHLGDYIYESGVHASATGGQPRRVVLPDGLQTGSSPDVGLKALTVADYRALYKQYRSDANMKRAHQLFPFMVVWDDHEFANDCWQDHATDFNDTRGDEKSPSRRDAANQAWFEYQLADVPYDADASYPDDITIYRSFRYGKHFEIFLIDGRYYRADHLIPEGPVDLSVGKFAADSSLGSRNFVLKSGFDEREAPARPTLLGPEQKTWLIDGLTESDATWKFLGSDVQLAQMAIDLSRFEQLPEQFRNRFYFSTDQWDGYRSERAEILEAVADVDNVIALAGDIHAFYASELFVDFDAPTRPAAIEFVVAGITSTSVQGETQATVDATPTLSALGLGELVPLFDEILVEGSPHYRYAKSSANGIAIIGVDRGRAVEVDFIHVDDVEKPKWNGRSEHVRFRVESGEKRIQRVRTALKRTNPLPLLRRLAGG